MTVERARLPMRVTPHMIRTTGINLLLRAGQPMQVAQAFAGHQRIATTEIYVRRINEDAEALEVMSVLTKNLPRRIQED